MKDVKLSRKLVNKEAARLSKKQKKAAAAANRGGNGESMRPAVFEDKRFKRNQKNIEHLYRSGKLD